MTRWDRFFVVVGVGLMALSGGELAVNETVAGSPPDWWSIGQHFLGAAVLYLHLPRVPGGQP